MTNLSNCKSFSHKSVSQTHKTNPTHLNLRSNVLRRLHCRFKLADVILRQRECPLLGVLAELVRVPDGWALHGRKGLHPSPGTGRKSMTT